MKILLVGINHRTAPVEVRERYAVDDPAPVLRKLCASDEIEEAVVISTCNRVEIVATSNQASAARLRLRHFFVHELPEVREPGPDPQQTLDDYLYELSDREAMCHVFRVTSSIDSMVVGEPQILGQVKDAYRSAIESGSCGPVLSRLFQHAFATAKRVKNETRIAERPVSVAKVAVELAEQIFEGLADKQALLVGAGEMIEAALHALQRQGLSSVRVVNRTRSRAEALAERFGASPHGLEELDDLLAGADVLLSCIGVSGYLLDADRVERALRRRRGGPMLLVDIGVPRNVDPDVNDLDSAYLYDIDDLQDVARSNAEARQRDSLQAEDIIVEEQERFDGWLVALQAVPTIRHLRARAEQIRSHELDRVLRRLDGAEALREPLEQLTRSLVNKLLHAPISRLRDETDREEGLVMLEAARALFALDGADPEPSPASTEEPDPE